MEGYLWKNNFGGIYGGISVVGYLGIEMINVGSTTESDLSERVWHSGQFVRLNRILFHTVDSQLLLMLIITRSLADHSLTICNISSHLYHLADMHIRFMWYSLHNGNI